MSGNLLKRLFAFFLCFLLFSSSVSASVTIHFTEEKTVTVRKEEDVAPSGGESVYSADETEDHTEADHEYKNNYNETEPDTENLYDETEVDIYMPARNYHGKTGTVSVLVKAPEGAFPEGTSMSVEDVEDQETLSTIEEAVSAHVSRIHAVNITFFDRKGRKVEPLVPVNVILTAEERNENEEALVIHVDDEGKTEEISSSEISQEEVEEAAVSAADEMNPDKNDAGRVSLKSKRGARRLTASAPAEPAKDMPIPEAGQSVQFTADQFSVYALVYTVDFEYSVNGKMYQFSLPGGGFVSFTDLVEVLGITGDTNSEEDGDENGSVIAGNAGENVANEGAEENGINSVTNTVITLGDVEVSEATRKFVADVASVEFSSPELVDVSKVDAETTVGKIKENRRLECEYSAELTEEQIAEINAQTVEAGDWALISVQPFTSEETLAVTMKNGEVFTIRVTDAQIKKTVIDAKGDTWEITVTYGEDAKIPDGAELKVEEILPEDEEYVDLYNRSIEVGANTAEKQGVELPVICGTRMFDIEIHGDDGEIEPAAPVQVNIRLVGSKQETEKLSVVHFADDGAEALNNREVGTADRDSYEVAFEAESFSVYTVQNFTSLSDYLNSAEYALVSERGTGITSADGINSVSNFAMISSMNGDSLSGKGVYMDKTATPRTVGGYVTEWGFENAGNNQYYIYMMDGNTKKYVKASGNNLVMDTTGTPFTATVSDNKVRFSYNGQSITSTGNNPSRFVLANNNSNDSLFNLCKVDPNYEEKVAKKVSAADWKAAENNPGKWDENDTVIIYRRIEHEDGSEDLYAVATDGTLIPVSDGGDSIYYHCPEGKNLNWHVVLGASGYYISNVIPEGSTESTVYLAPSVTNGTWSSSSAIGLTLGGMGNTYDTTIENWDQAAYAYAGLHVDATNATTLAEGVTPGSGVTSDTFLFAVSDTLISEGQLHTVNTVDSTSKGITMKIFNYGGSTSHGGYRNDDMQSVMGDAMTSDWDNRKSHVTRTVESKLGDDGFPVSLTNGYGSYAGLFTLKDNGGVAESASDANHLFLQSYYDENGMFRYSSLENFAHFNTSGEHTGEFTVYREAGTPNIPTANDHYYYYHGHFMPYNDLDPTVSVSRIVDQYGSMEDKEMGRSYENVYGLSETPDYYVGMTLEAKFVQPSGGTLENGDPVVFKFTGDDDMLVYIDGILVLDVGGIHEPLTGSINFETGTVYQPNFYNEGAGWQTHTTTLYQIFRNAYNNGLISEDDWAKMKWVDADGDGIYDTFANHTTHNFNMFYFERGAGASNLDVQFNLQVTKKDEFTVRKTIPEGEKSEFVNQLYKFKAYFIDDTEPDSAKKKKLLYPGATKADGSTVCTKVLYADLKDASGKPIEKNVPFDAEDHSFTLRSGEAAVFSMASEEIVYDVYEIDLDGNLIEQVDINGTTTAIDSNTHEVSAGEETVENRSEVNVTNHPITQNLRVTKHITEDSLSEWEADKPVFEFRVYLEQFVTDTNGDIVYANVTDPDTGTTVQKPKTKLVPYARSPYYLVKIPAGQENNEAAWEYYTLTGDNNTPVLQSHGTVCSITGRSGTINSIPPEYTIIIPELAVGTHFYVEERRVTIPEGYEFDHELLKDETYDESTLVIDGDHIDQVMTIDEYSNDETHFFDANSVGRIKKGKDAEFDVWNRKPAIEIPVEKTWVGGTTPRPDVTLALIRYMPQEKYTPPVGQGAIIIDHVADYGENNNSTDLPAGFVATYAIEKLNTTTNEYEVVATGTSGPFDVDPGQYRISTTVNNRGNEPVNYTYDKTDPVIVTVQADQSVVAKVTSKYNYEQGGKITIVHNAAYEGGEHTGTTLPDGINVTYTIKDESTNRIVHRNVAAGTYDVPAGTYTVTANVSDPAAPETYVYQDTTAAEHVTVTSGGTANAELISTYVYVEPKSYGYITVSHESSGLTGTSPNLPQNFQVTSYRIVGPTTINNAQLGQEYQVEAGEYTVIANVNYAPVVDGYVYAGTPDQEAVVGTDEHKSVKLTSIYGRQGAIRIVHTSTGMSGTNAIPGDMSVQYTIVNNVTGETLRSNVSAGTYNVPAGEYTVTPTVYYEGTAPEGYFYLGTDPVTVTVLGEETADANVVSRYGAKGTITINHVSEGLTNSPTLASGSSVQYTIYDATGNPVQGCQNVSAGTYTVAPGNYTVTSHYNYHPVPNGYEYLEGESTESVSVTVESSQNTTANLISKYQRIGGNNTRVRLCVDYWPNTSNMTVGEPYPLNSTIHLQYTGDYQWGLYYNAGNNNWPQIGERHNAPGSSGANIELGDKSEYCIVIYTDHNNESTVSPSITTARSVGSLSRSANIFGLANDNVSAVHARNQILASSVSGSTVETNSQTASIPVLAGSAAYSQHSVKRAASGTRSAPAESTVSPSRLVIPDSIANAIIALNQNLAGNSAGYEYSLDTSFGKQVVLSDPWSYTFDDLEELGEGGHPYYYALIEVSVPEDYEVSYLNNPVNASDIRENMDARAAAQKHNEEHPDDPVPVPALLTLSAVNTSTSTPTGSVKVTKSFSGINSLPSGFKITASYNDGTADRMVELTTATAGMTGTGTSGDPYTWTIDNLPIGTVVTFAESGFDEAGYTVLINGEATASSKTATAAETPGTASFVNEYTRNPGGLELTKKVSGTGADQTKEFVFTIELTAPTGTTLAETYPVLKTEAGETSLTLDRTDGNTKASITVSLKHNQSWEIKDLPVGTGYTITETDYSGDGYTQSITKGIATGIVSGGTVTKEEVEFTNTYSAVDVTVIKIDESTRNAEHPENQTTLSGAKFKLYKLTVPEGGSVGTYTVYPNSSSSEKTTGDDGTLTFEKLPNGKYMIEETSAPAGYVKQREIKIYFTVSEGSTVTYTNEAGETIESQTLVTYTPADQSFTVGNTPGAALPNTGGPGTRHFTILGSILILGAGVLLWRRRRLI